MRFLQAFFPERCIFCGQVISNREGCCENCAVDLPWYAPSVPEKLFYKQHFIDFCAPFYYTKNVKSAIYRFKFRGKKGYARFFAAYMAQQVQKSMEAYSFDFLAYVPAFHKRRNYYNTAEILAKALSKKLGIPLLPEGGLKKIKDTPQQHTLGRVQRQQNVKGAFNVITLEDIKGKTILLCDDILTTGATAKQCSWQLYRAGAQKVACIAVAYTP